MTVRSLAARTQQSNSSSVADLARYHDRSPDQISYDEVVDWIHHLIRDRHLAASSVNIAVNGVRFHYAVALQREVAPLLAGIPRMKRNVTRAEVYARSWWTKSSTAWSRLHLAPSAPPSPMILSRHDFVSRRPPRTGGLTTGLDRPGIPGSPQPRVELSTEASKFLHGLQQSPYGGVGPASPPQLGFVQQSSKSRDPASDSFFHARRADLLDSRFRQRSR